MAEYYTRMGDGKRVLLSKQQILDDIFEGTADAADMGEIPQLNDGEMEHIAEIIMCQDRVVGVTPGNEVVTAINGTITSDTLEILLIPPMITSPAQTVTIIPATTTLIE